MPVLLASVTDSLVTFATDVVSDLGVAGVFVLMTLESACIPIPSEATMLFAGFGVAKGDHSLFAITAAGVAGNLVGSWMAYGVGWLGRLELVERHGSKLHMKPEHLAWADRWFARYGDAAVFFSRLLPIIRTFISLPAGVARMPFWRFTVLTVVGCVPWVLALALIGRHVGDRWEDWKDNLHYVDLVVLAAIGLTIVVLAVRWWRRRRSGTPAAGDVAA